MQGGIQLRSRDCGRLAMAGCGVGAQEVVGRRIRQDRQIGVGGHNYEGSQVWEGALRGCLQLQQQRTEDKPLR